MYYCNATRKVKANFSKWHPWLPSVLAWLEPVCFPFALNHKPAPAAIFYQTKPKLQRWQQMHHTHLINPPDVVLSENTAQGLVNAISCPSEAVLVAGPASRCFGCVHHRRTKHQKHNENPDSLHGTKHPKAPERNVYYNVCRKWKTEVVFSCRRRHLAGCNRLRLRVLLSQRLVFSPPTRATDYPTDGIN